MHHKRGRFEPVQNPEQLSTNMIRLKPSWKRFLRSIVYFSCFLHAVIVGVGTCSTTHLADEPLSQAVYQTRMVARYLNAMIPGDSIDIIFRKRRVVAYHTRHVRNLYFDMRYLSTL